MRQLLKRTEKKLLISSLCSYMLVLLIPFALSILCYCIAVSQSQARALDANNHVLLAASQELSMRISEVNNISTEIVNNSSVLRYQRNTTGFRYPYSYRMNETREALNNYKLTQSFLDDYFLFFNNSRTVINNNIIYTYEDFFQNYFLDSSISPDEMVRLVEQSGLDTGLTSAREISLCGIRGNYLPLVKPLLGQNTGYLMVLIQQEDITSLFDNINLGDSGAIYVSNYSGDILLSITEEHTNMDALLAQTQDQIAQDSPAHFYIHANEKMMVNQLNADRMVYVSIQPMEIALADASVYRNIMIVCLLISLVVGIFLCLRQAYFASAPVSDILHEMDIKPGDSSEAFQAIRKTISSLQASNANLSKLASEHKSLLRSSFTNRLIRGSFSSDAEAQRICSYVMPDHADFHTACVVLLTLETRGTESSDTDQLKLLASQKLILKGTIDRCLEHPLTYDLDDKTLVLVLFNVCCDEVDQLYKHILQMLPRSLRNSLFTFGGTQVTSPLQKIARSFEQAHMNMLMWQQSLKAGTESIIWASAQSRSLQYFFPSDMRYRLSESIRSGNSDNVEQLLLALFHSNDSVSLPLRHIFLSELLGLALDCVQTLDVTHRPSDEHLLEDIEEILTSPPHLQQQLLLQLFCSLSKCVEYNTEQTDHMLVQQAITLMEQSYTDSSLSVTMISEHLNVNASMLSTIFKQKTNKNISTYLEDLRIQNAQHLLRTTNIPIKQIAETVGYLSTNSFCRAFRRNTGYNATTYKSMVARLELH